MASSRAPIRVLLVVHSPHALSLQKRMLATSANIRVVGTAAHGREALRLMQEVQPQVICTDAHMPVMGGQEFIEHVMAIAPCPILVVAATSAAKPNDATEFQPLLAAGAIDFFPKPNATQPFDETARAFVKKIELLAGVFVFSRRPAPANIANGIANALAANAHAANAQIEYSISSQNGTAVQNDCALDGARSTIRFVAVGASTGGPHVLEMIFSSLPANFPVPILCVQHISAGFLDGLVEWLNDRCRLRIKSMEEGETASGGTVYFPREGRHMEIDARGQLLSSARERVDGHQPSVTQLFVSLAKNHGACTLAILLTGMGEDGARGLLEVREAGGATIAQDEASSVVFGMPRQAIARGAAQQVLPDNAISAAILRAVQRR